MTIEYLGINFTIIKNQIDPTSQNFIQGFFISSETIDISFANSTIANNFLSEYIIGTGIKWNGGLIATNDAVITTPTNVVKIQLYRPVVYPGINTPSYGSIIDVNTRRILYPFVINILGMDNNINIMNIGVDPGISTNTTNLDSFYLSLNTPTAPFSYLSIEGNNTGNSDFSTGIPNNYGVRAISAPTILTCLLKGTKILTPTGEVLIEDIKIGDDVITADNRTVKVIDTNYNLANSDEHLYVIRKDIVSKGVPNEDLFLTGGHLVKIDGKYYHPFHNKTNLIEKSNESKFVVFYHITLQNYLTDFLVANGLQVESKGDINNPDHTIWDCTGDECILLAMKEKV